MIRFVGVDGCTFGWIAAFVDAKELTYSLFRNFDELVGAFPHADLILVDIPIGLPWADCPSRPCDTIARRVLGTGRASSVFPAPSRPACKADGIEEARALNLAELGRSLSAQAWGICRKVAVVDEVLLSNPVARLKVREMHPEVCFWGLSGGIPMLHAKSTRDGVEERIAVLSSLEPRARRLLETVLRERRRKDVKADDVLDALAGLVTAASEFVLRLQGDPASDNLGLPMEMVYAGGPEQGLAG